MFKAKKYENLHAHTFKHIAGTDEEVFLIGEVVTLSSDLLTKGAVTSAGVQKYIMLQSATGDGVTPLACLRIDRNISFKVESANVASGTYVLGTVYTLNTGAVGITNTATAGVFSVDENCDDGGVVGHFQTVYDR